jgi:Fe-S-cluster containining protein
MKQESAPPLNFELDRKSPFSFFCRACGRCCSGKIIMVGPHEILGMSRLLRIDTTELLSLHTDNGGTTLRADENGRCVFLTPSGCQVHPRRPLVCRLYPLGRVIDEKGDERFGLYAVQSDCEAAAGREGTVGSFLESQGVGPYLGWSRRYGDLYRRMIGLLNRFESGGALDAPADAETREKDEPPAPSQLSAWQDIDASLAEYCAAKGLRAPREIDESIALHIRAMEEWLDDLDSRLEKGENGEKGN